MESTNKKGQTCFDYALSLAGGNRSVLARVAGCTPQAVHQWARRGVVPVGRVKAVAKFFKVPCSKLNPVFER